MMLLALQNNDAQVLRPAQPGVRQLRWLKRRSLNGSTPPALTRPPLPSTSAAAREPFGLIFLAAQNNDAQALHPAKPGVNQLRWPRWCSLIHSTPPALTRLPLPSTGAAARGPFGLIFLASQNNDTQSQRPAQPGVSGLRWLKRRSPIDFTSEITPAPLNGALLLGGL